MLIENLKSTLRVYNCRICTIAVTTKLSNVEEAFGNCGKNLHCFFLIKMSSGGKNEANFVCGIPLCFLN